MLTSLLKHTQPETFKNPSAQHFKIHGRQNPFIIEYLWQGGNKESEANFIYSCIVTSKMSTIGQNTRTLQEKQHYEIKTADSDRTETAIYSQGARLALNKLTQVPEAILP